MPRTIRKFTYQDYVCFPEDGRRHEIIDGDHYVNPAPNLYHQAVSRRIQFQLYTQIELAGLGVVMDAPVDVQLSETDVVQPDLVVVLNANRILTPSKVKGPPEHLVEILSPSSEKNDRLLKRALYERSGVNEYWIVDPFEHALLQLVLIDGVYYERPPARRVEVSYLPNVMVDLDKVW